jgi:SpoVK/Ycf46/Vps4 family AAA+-type ATPase
MWIEFYYCASMAKAYQKHDLAKARSSRHNKSEELELETDSGESDLDCGYEGGVDCDPSNGEQDYEDDQWSDDESLAELERDELEANLSALCEEAESQDAPNVFKQMMRPKDSKEWSKAEANWALGYNKNSSRTQERRRKEAREREASKIEAKTSWALVLVTV